jgi:hypothetical protein
MESTTQERFDRVEAHEANKLNHWVYCHHCRHMGKMSLFGRDMWGRVVFVHPRTGCSGMVRIAAV